MSKTMEYILWGVGGFFLLSILKNGAAGANQSAQISANQNVGLANSAASVINTALNDFTN